MYLFFDTETNGLPIKRTAPVEDLDNWPRLVQLAFLLYDFNGTLISSGNFIIKPDGFVIPSNVADIHRISTERALSEGVPVLSVLNDFSKTVRDAKYLVAHNMYFDKRVVGAEYLRIGLEDSLKYKKKICTMHSSTKFCGIGKWPTLQELHCKLFNSSFEEAHDAAVDIQATANCFWELKKLGII